MKRLLIYLLLISLIFVASRASAQFYDIGQAPASIRWNTIESENFSVIYPEYFPKAKNVLISFIQARDAVVSGIAEQPKHTPLILHPLNPVSNAYAIWAPRRIEILTTPPQDMYAQPWFQQLALHEYRHIAQLSSLNQGFTRYLGYVFGQQAAALSTGIFVPSWFIEGDAVVTETAFSEAGRGRVASFSHTLRAQLKEKGAYGYAKASLGSYKDFVPDIYTTGYHIISAANLRYGLRPWQQAMNTVARKPWSVTPFNLGLKRSTGKNKKGIYQEAMMTLDSIWGREPGNVAMHLNISKPDKSYSSYLHPFRINDTLFTAYLESFTSPPQIVTIDIGGKVTRIHTPGYIIDERITFDGKKLTWAEYRPHLRWETAGYTSIVQLDPYSRKVSRQEYRRKLYAPASNPGTGEIAAIEYTKEGDCLLSVIKSLSIEEYKLPDSIHGTTPCWSPGGESVIFIATGERGKALARITLATGNLSYITGFSFTEISNPFFAGEKLCFTGSYDGVSQIFMAGSPTGSFHAITRAAYGADFASMHEDELVFSDYTADGYRIAVQPPAEEPYQKYYQGSSKEWPLAEALSSGVKRVIFKSNDGFETPEVNRYRKASHLFSFHSWAPVYLDIGGETVRPGLSVMSQNLLSTLFVSGGYDYNLQEEAGMYRADITWKGWFPILKATFSEGQRAGTASNSETGETKRFTWNETNLDLGISQRLNFSEGAFIRVLYGGAEYNYTQIRHNNSTPAEFARGNLTGLTYRIAGYAYHRQAYRDLAPRTGIYADAEFRHTPFGQLKAGNIFAAQLQVYLPGFMRNHSLQLYGGIQFSNPEKYRFPDLISISRGYTSEVAGNELFAVKVTYRLPLIYPDLQAGGLLYVKRIRTGLFHDFTHVSVPELHRNFSSTGVDIVADLHLFGLSTPVGAGARIVYLHDKAKFVSGPLISVNLYEY